ncbi:hypothetical protein [Gorillibacterium timonense]|uniref:hypothetical protein n=1 Tax=Gorillibacterium timonense TaxID=1689269 RepID=UPI00071CF8C8|nr:hypothetical protein [Gorillibacterium timonense]
MLMASYFDSYCCKCGFPILKGDMFDYQPENRSGDDAYCLICHAGIPPETPCPHLAVWTTGYQYSSSRKIRHGPWSGETTIICEVCHAKLSEFPETTLAVKTMLTMQHGGMRPVTKTELTIMHHLFSRHIHRFNMVAAALWNLIQQNELSESLMIATEAHFDKLLRMLPD